MSRADRGDDVWAQFIESYYGEMITDLNKGDTKSLLSYLTALPRKGAGHGYLQGEAAFRALQHNPESQAERAMWLMDHLIALAEAVGVVHTRCPEQGDWSNPPIESLDDICQKIEEVLGRPIRIPEVFDGFFSLLTREGAVHIRSIMSTYAIIQLHKITRLIDEPAPEDLNIAEIGAGIGFTAYAWNRPGTGSYTIYDLPEVNVAQGFFLLKTLGPKNVSLFGEPQNGLVRILPSSHYGSGDENFDITINVDSLPEISSEIADRYLAEISRNSRYFFSINQEAPREGRRSVLEAASGHARLKPMQRHLNWIRASYVEELFRCS